MKKIYLVTIPSAQPNVAPTRFVCDSLDVVIGEYSTFVVETIDYKEPPLDIFN